MIDLVSEKLGSLWDQIVKTIKMVELRAGSE